MMSLPASPGMPSPSAPPKIMSLPAPPSISPAPAHAVSHAAGDDVHVTGAGDLVAATRVGRRARRRHLVHDLVRMALHVAVVAGHAGRAAAERDRVRAEPAEDDVVAAGRDRVVAA